MGVKLEDAKAGDGTARRLDGSGSTWLGTQAGAVRRQVGKEQGSGGQGGQAGGVLETGPAPAPSHAVA